MIDRSVFFLGKRLYKTRSFPHILKPRKIQSHRLFHKYHPASHHRVMGSINITLSNRHIDSRHRGSVNYSRENTWEKVICKPGLVTYKFVLTVHRDNGAPKGTIIIKCALK